MDYFLFYFLFLFFILFYWRLCSEVGGGFCSEVGCGFCSEVGCGLCSEVGCGFCSEVGCGFCSEVGCGFCPARWKCRFMYFCRLKYVTSSPGCAPSNTISSASGSITRRLEVFWSACSRMYLIIYCVTSVRAISVPSSRCMKLHSSAETWAGFAKPDGFRAAPLLVFFRRPFSFFSALTSLLTVFSSPRICCWTAVTCVRKFAKLANTASN